MIMVCHDDQLTMRVPGCIGDSHVHHLFRHLVPFCAQLKSMSMSSTTGEVCLGHTVVIVLIMYPFAKAVSIILTTISRQLTNRCCCSYCHLRDTTARATRARLAMIQYTSLDHPEKHRARGI